LSHLDPAIAVLSVIAPGLSITVQDGGRSGWRRFGIPPGGAMDRRAMWLANRLLDNPADAPVLECLQGGRLIALENVDLALAGAWGARAWTARPDEIIEMAPSLAGVWQYLAVPGGIQADRFLGSASVCARAGIGDALKKGDRITCLSTPTGRLPERVKCRRPAELLDYDGDAPLHIWPGPQWNAFDAPSRNSFLGQKWRVSARSDRTGYRLEGAPLTPPSGNLTSEPVRVGSVQVPPDGQPVVTLNDGPTVGGYAKIALVDADDLARLVQTRPGQGVRFRRMD
jgi:biotin-dependent carboxylase-like uncharacterized protein